MTITSFVPRYALYVPQHFAVSLLGPLNQKTISSVPYAETVFACFCVSFSTVFTFCVSK